MAPSATSAGPLPRSATCSTRYSYVVAASNGTCLSADSAAASTTTPSCGGSGGCTTLYTNSFEGGSGTSDWTTGSYVGDGGSGQTDWRGIQSCSAHSGSGIFRFGGATCSASYAQGDFAFAIPQLANGIAIPSTAGKTTLSFWHRFNFTLGASGASLAIAVGASQYVYVPASAILSGVSYNGSFSGTCPGDAANAPIFTGNQGTFVNTVVDLDAACNSATGGTQGCAGQPVYLAFIGITGCSDTGAGWFLDDVTVTSCPSSGGQMSFYTVPPCRIFDTRGTSPLTAGVRSFQVAGACGIPAGAKAISANLTIVQPHAGGYITVFPGDAAQPATSTLNFNAGQVRANNAVLLLAGDGSGTLNVFLASSGATNLLLDVNGYFK